jgi:raffinose/stachyose/melibiose transport system substrate-binding protein
MQVYFDQGRTGLALEFESPIKGPNLEQILVEVMIGRMTPLAAAQAYDEDVRRQAIQLGIAGW